MSSDEYIEVLRLILEESKKMNMMMGLIEQMGTVLELHSKTIDILIDQAKKK